ncbi:FAD-dependent monooxygenase [Peribacillus frigoritolerans]|nr:FAD-dependent monooxygenase [Peribacillus frigoritolerans]
MALVNGSQVALFSQAGGFIQIGWNIEHGSFPHLRKQHFEPFIENLLLAFPELKKVVCENIRSWQDFILLDVYSSYCETWTKEGVALLGDAAHTMTPTGAFGLNCAMKDADILAELISGCILQGILASLDLKWLSQIEKPRLKDYRPFRWTRKFPLHHSLPPLMFE